MKVSKVSGQEYWVPAGFPGSWQWQLNGRLLGHGQIGKWMTN